VSASPRKLEPDALAVYEDGLSGQAAGKPRLRLTDGTLVTLDLARWLGPADPHDQAVLQGVAGPVLDVGCGPGRHSHALARRGVYSLGVDLSPVAVALAVDRGANAIVGDVFAELPGAGQWRTVLLLDGNIGIGGAPERLLRRLAGVLAPGGALLVELDAPGTPSGWFRARLEHGARTSDWFGWARVAADAIVPIAAGAGLAVSDRWAAGGRWFARLHGADAAGASAGTGVAGSLGSPM
jgi:SAM-dependent methyltransferase